MRFQAVHGVTRHLLARAQLAGSVIDLTMTDDNIDEPDTETFTIVISSTDTDDGRVFGSNNTLNVNITDDATDLPPYVYFNDVSQYVDETDGDLVVTVQLSLNAGSSFLGAIYSNFSFYRSK